MAPTEGMLGRTYIPRTVAVGGGSRMLMEPLMVWVQLKCHPAVTSSLMTSNTRRWQSMRVKEVQVPPSLYGAQLHYQPLPLPDHPLLELEFEPELN